MTYFEKNNEMWFAANTYIMTSIHLLYHFVDIGRVSSEVEKRVLFPETWSQREHIFMNFDCPKREWAKWVSEPVNEA